VLEVGTGEENEEKEMEAEEVKMNSSLINEVKASQEDEEDEFVDYRPIPDKVSSTSTYNFSYSTSPGFKHKSAY